MVVVDESLDPKNSEGTKVTETKSVGSKDYCGSSMCTNAHGPGIFCTDKATKDSRHQFWDSQPVPKADEVIGENINQPIDKRRNKKDVRTTPYDLPPSLFWDDIDTSDDNKLDEVFELLKENYVKDDENLFQFAYPKNFLLWALRPPGFKPCWHLGVRNHSENELVGFIAAIPIKIHVFDKILNCVDINFLCLKEILRNKRFAPLLIQEITRRVNLFGIFQAVHTAGHLYSQPFTKATYFHRNLNIKKVVDTGFGSIPQKMTMKMAMKLYSLPQVPKIQGFRQIKPKDVIPACSLLAEYVKKFKVHTVYNQDRFRHEFMHDGDCVYSFVVENNNVVTDFISFYSLPSTVLNHKVHKTLNVAYLYAMACSTTTPQDLLMDCLIVAKNKGFDVFNALDLMEIQSAFQNLKFIAGNGVLKYYFYNWLCPNLHPSEVAIVLQ